MCKEPVLGSLFVDVPNDDALVVGGAGHELIIFGDDNVPHPGFMANECFFAISSANFPKLDSFIPGARNKAVGIVKEGHKGNVVVVPE